MARADTPDRKSRADDIPRNDDTPRADTPDAYSIAITEVDSYSIDTFYLRHGMSPQMYVKMRQQGLGPREFRIGSRVKISKEAATEWRRERERAHAQATEHASDQTEHAT
jgi:hypothetical protein